VDFIFSDLQKLISIIVVDLVLSGDNAVVIGMAARTLDPQDRRKAIVWGGAGAVGLRIVFTILAALLLDIPLIQAAGGVLLVWIAFRLVVPESHSDVAHVAVADTFAAAVRTIILADVVMSLDNILAVGGASEGHLGLLVFGLALSVPILLFGSNVVARLLHRHPWLLIVGVLVLVHSALTMILHDHWVESAVDFAAPQWEILLATIILTGVLLVVTRQRHGGIAGIGEPHRDAPASSITGGA
jgi:YjbE family integral membrane protein